MDKNINELSYCDPYKESFTLVKNIIIDKYFYGDLRFNTYETDFDNNILESIVEFLVNNNCV